LFRPAVKWGGPIFEFRRIGEVLCMAFREMWIGRPRDDLRSHIGGGLRPTGQADVTRMEV